MPEALTVKHAQGEYPIVIDSGSLNQLGMHLTRHKLGGPVGIITQPDLNTRFGETVRDSLMAVGLQTRTILIPEGERFKTLATAEQAITALLEQGLERGSTIVTLGGGVIGDMGGFVASILYRGIPFVQVPTTLLAMVDASVGGKTGVNHPVGKNLIGAFHQPRLVLMDPDTLTSLSPRDRLAGFAEMIKLGFVLDKAYLDFLQQHESQVLNLSDPETVAAAIRRSCELKAAVVEADEREQGLRKVLNFGHTIAHAIEKTTDYRKFRHGEAVLLGMYGAAWISHQLEYINAAEWEQVAGFLKQLPLEMPVADLDAQAIELATHQDKKVKDGRVVFVLMKGVGAYVFNDRVPAAMVQLAVDAIKEAWKDS